jgi:hypothetical protein
MLVGRAELHSNMGSEQWREAVIFGILRNKTFIGLKKENLQICLARENRVSPQLTLSVA